MSSQALKVIPFMDGPMSEGERRFLGMFRRMSDDMKREVFSYVQFRRTTPDLPPPTRYATAEDWMTAAVNEDGTPYKKDPSDS